MGSKRSSSKNPDKLPSSPPPAAPPNDENFKKPRNPNLSSPSKPRKKQKLSIPTTPGKILPSPIPSTEVEAPSHNSNHKDMVPDSSNEISPTDATGNLPKSFRWSEAHSLKFLKALLAFKSKKGSLPKPSNMEDFLTEIKSWCPVQLSEKNVDSKIRHLRFKIHKNPKPGPDNSEFDRSFYEIGKQVFGPVSLNVMNNSTGSLNVDTLKENDVLEKKDKRMRKNGEPSNNLKEEKQDVDGKKEDVGGVEMGENDSEDDEGSDEKVEKSMQVENGEVHEKEDLLAREDNGVLDNDMSGYPYKYLKVALEDCWTQAMLNKDILYSALPYVDLVAAKRLDQQFLEVFERMLKLKMEKNKVSNNVIGSSLGH